RIACGSDIGQCSFGLINPKDVPTTNRLSLSASEPVQEFVPPRDRTTAHTTHTLHTAATRQRTLRSGQRRAGAETHGPAGTFPVGPASSGASTSAPGRGRAVGRAGITHEGSQPGPRLAGSAQTSCEPS